MCSSVAVSALASIAPGNDATTASARNRAEHGGIPAVRARPAGRRSPGGRSRAGRRSSSAAAARADRRGSSRSTTRCAPTPGSRPACSAASRTVATQRSTVSSVKNVCSTTMSKRAPGERERVRPERDEAERDVLVERRRRGAGPGTSRPGRRGRTITSPCHRRRISPTKSSICAVVIRGMPYASNIGAMPRPSPSVKRPPVSRCIVVAYDAVTIGWRVLWFVAAVAMPSVRDTAPTAPDSVTASLMLKRSEMNVLPEPERLARLRLRRAAPPATAARRRARRSRARSVVPQRRAWYLHSPLSSAPRGEPGRVCGDVGGRACWSSTSSAGSSTTGSTRMPTNWRPTSPARARSTSTWRRSPRFAA